MGGRNSGRILKLKNPDSTRSKKYNIPERFIVKKSTVRINIFSTRLFIIASICEALLASSLRISQIL